MATSTLGTDATTSLTALAFLPGIGSLAAADVASINNGIKNDLNPALPLVPGAFSSAGLLVIPNRGIVQVLPGDYVAIDSTGWPILLSRYAAANGPWAT